MFAGLLSDSDIDLAVDHLTRLLLTDEDESVRSGRLSSIVLSLLNESGP